MKNTPDLARNEKVDIKLIEKSNDQKEVKDFGRKPGGVFQTFIIVFLIHLLILLLMTLLSWSEMIKTSNTIVSISSIDDVVTNEEFKSIVVTKVEANVKFESSIEMLEMEITDEVEEEITDSLPEVIGVIGNIGGGLFGHRSGGGKMKAIMQGGGSRKTENAVEAALRWLKRHQVEDGFFYTDIHISSVKKYKRHEAVTSLAVLAFLSAGHTPRTGEFKKTVEKGLSWILAQQNADGSWGKGEFQIYDAAICTLTLVECYGMYPNVKIKKAAQKGINYLLNPNPNKIHFGYKNKAYQSMSVLGWIVMAIKSAKIAGLKVPKNAFKPYRKRIHELTEYYNGQRRFVSYVKKNDRNWNSTTMTSVGMLCNLYLGVPKVDLSLQADLIARTNPSWNVNKVDVFDFYNCYYGTLSLFQYGGKYWKNWNQNLIKALLPSQEKGGPLDGSAKDRDGSWPPITRFRSKGRVFTTAMGALCLEVYYRYKSMDR
ncbi:MAG: hypothetical protein COA79_19015 [Planctomycetota bacterium]|nr:MAG: hypothetical protein COA79_19015 [Planctomycetota bacterium]